MASAEDRELRDALETAQHENKNLRVELAEQRAFDLEGLLSRIASLEEDNGELRQRLDRADVVREKWYRRTQQLRNELEAALQEQRRLRSVLEDERLSHQPSRRR
jgi:predicted nuclease with TOPRIM domain